ncbi:PA2778 family cysteine peptidase [Paraglaciecola sp.]|uniref:PA2778 family cysteine peptidase n=1 Tax=Paraglaciecola sp. TaxID=1920173 RepID=UPI003EF0BA09
MSIKTLPFYPQEQFYCGPTTLAEVYNYFGRNVTPESVAPNIFIPDREGSLQLEMVSTTRQFGFVPYSQRGSLEQVIRLVSAGIPVIVLQNNSIPLFPMWHYAVVKGYNLAKSQLILNTGVTENHSMSFELFERTWQRSGYWMLVPLPTNMANSNLEPHIYIKAAHDLMEVGKHQMAITSLKSAITQWPEKWLSYFLLGNYYLKNNPTLAVEWFYKGAKYGQNQPDYLNNYSYALSNVGCHQAALRVIGQALTLTPEDANIQDTFQHILSAKSAPKPASIVCEKYN